MERKILVAIDPSSYSPHIASYLCGLFDQQPDIKFHFLSIVSHSTSQAAKDWLDQKDMLSSIDNASRKRFLDAKSHLEKAKKKFLEGGFSTDQVELSARLSRVGVVADIIQEAKAGLYDALIIGKKNLGRLEKMIVGSVSTELLTKNAGLPVWVVNGQAKPQKIILPVDCSPHTLDAADHLAFIVKDNPEIEITLFHSCSMLAREEITPKEQFYEKWGQEWSDKHLQGDDDGHFHFSAPEQIFKDAGISPARIHRLNSKSGIEPGQMIVQHVKHDGYGTIVMGRRHKDVNKGIFQGVSDRVLANVSDVAIWIIG